MRYPAYYMSFSTAHDTGNGQPALQPPSPAAAQSAGGGAASVSTPLILPRPPSNYRQRSQAMDMPDASQAHGASSPLSSLACPPSNAASASGTALASASSTASQASPPLHPPPPPLITASTRYYHLWPGRHTFLCGGRVLLGSNPVLAVLTLLLTLSCSALYSLFIMPHFSLLLSLPFFLLLPVIIVSFLLAALCDPGIVPPSLVFPPSPTPPADADVDGESRRYCPYCRLYRPRRCKHCKYCNVCVEEFDHHCPWIGNCVGRRNYRHYLAFIAALTAVCPVLALLSLLRLVDVCEARGGFVLTSLDALLPLLLTVFFLLTSLFALSLSSYHAFLLSSASTTNEEVRGVWKGRGGAVGNMYNRGCIGNLNRVCCEANTAGGEAGHGSGQQQQRGVLGWARERVVDLAALEAAERRRWEEGERLRRERDERDRRKGEEWRRRRRQQGGVKDDTQRSGGGSGNAEELLSHDDGSNTSAA